MPVLSLSKEIQMKHRFFVACAAPQNDSSGSYFVILSVSEESVFILPAEVLRLPLCEGGRG